MHRPRSTITDFVQIGVAAIFWHMRDTIGAPAQRRARVLRIPVL